MNCMSLKSTERRAVRIAFMIILAAVGATANGDNIASVPQPSPVSPYWLLQGDTQTALRSGHFYRQTIEAEFDSVDDAAKATLAFRDLPPGMAVSVSARGDDTDRRHLANANALSAADAKGTYYLNWLDNEYVETVVRPILALGHSIGGHTVRHPHLPMLNANGIFEEILWNRIVIETAADTCVNAFTLPFCDWKSSENPDVSRAIGESLRRAGYMGGGDIIPDPATAYGLPAGSFVGTVQYSYDDKNPSPEIFSQKIAKLEKRIQEENLPPCGPHATMGMHSWAKPEGVPDVTRAFETLTRNPDSPFFGRAWLCTENEFIAAWMQSRHSRVETVERNGAGVRWTILRPDAPGLGADVPLSVEVAPRPASMRVDGIPLAVTENGQAAIGGQAGAVLPSLIDHIAFMDDADGSLRPSAKFPGIAAFLDVDLAAGMIRLDLRNDSYEALRRLRVVLRVPLAFEAEVLCGEEEEMPVELAAGASRELHFRLKCASDAPWYCEGTSLFDAELDFATGGKPGRIHVTRRL